MRYVKGRGIKERRVEGGQRAGEKDHRHSVRGCGVLNLAIGTEVYNLVISFFPPLSLSKLFKTFLETRDCQF